MRLTDFKVLSFDCYGTLIDWESGIFAALTPLLARAGVQAGRDAVLETYGEHEARQEAATPSMPYSELLATVHDQLARHWGVAQNAGESCRFGGSVGDWPAFADSAAALAALQRHFKLVILSNVDRASFAASNRRLGVTFDAIYTAQDIGSYKPDPRNFDYLLARLGELGFAPSELLHTAQSLFHDHAVAHRFGLATAWIDRRGEQAGWGATRPPPEAIRTDFRFPTLAAMAAACRLEAGAAQAAASRAG